MIFVEGGNAPYVVHEDFSAALKLAGKYAKNNRGKEVLVLQISKRIIKPVLSPEEAEPVKLPAHLPPEKPTGNKRLGLKDLVFKESLKSE